MHCIGGRRANLDAFAHPERRIVALDRPTSGRLSLRYLGSGAQVLDRVRKVSGNHRGHSVKDQGTRQVGKAMIRVGGKQIRTLAVLANDMGIEHALASRRLYTDGAELLFDYAAQLPDTEGDAIRELVVLRSGQRVFSEIIEEYLHRIEYDATDTRG
jgi:hypothetical protein